jgi:hypothetical protein
MSAEGFEYIPFMPSDVGGGFGYEEEDEGDWVKQNGFGVSTWVLMEEEFAEDAENDPWADDPNMSIVDAMDEFEREEYYRILYGGEPENIENTPWEEIEAMTPEEQEQFYDDAYRDWQPEGCEPAAYDEAFGAQDDMAFWEEFGDDFEDFYMRAEADPRIVEAQSGWSACMAERGHDFATQEDMHAYFWGTEVNGEWVDGEFGLKVNELITWPESQWDEEFAEGEAGSSVATTVTLVTEGEEVEFEYQGPEYDLEKLQPLIDEEIAVATADWECSQGMWDLFDEVYKEIEQQFLEENLDRLLEFKAEHS